LNADIFGLVPAQLRPLYAESGEMQAGPPSRPATSAARRTFLLVLAVLVVALQFDLCGRVWLVKRPTQRRSDGPWALPRFTQAAFRHHDMMTVCFLGFDLVDLRLMFVHFRLRRPAIGPRCRTVPMFQTRALILPLHRAHVLDGCDVLGCPVAVTKMSAFWAASSMVTTLAFHRRLQRQIGSISETRTCSRTWRSYSADPLPTSPKPATIANLGPTSSRRCRGGIAVAHADFTSLSCTES